MINLKTYAIFINYQLVKFKELTFDDVKSKELMLEDVKSKELTSDDVKPIFNNIIFIENIVFLQEILFLLFLMNVCNIAKFNLT